MADYARDELVATFKHLLLTGEYSDLVVTCGSDTYALHKSVLCTRSGFFKRAERFPVGKEAAEGHIDLPDDEPATIKLLIQYLYEGEYDPKLPDGYASSNGLRNAVVTGPKITGHHYNFPHTCLQGCPVEFQVCPHHECRPKTCGERCVDFTCSKCCGAPTAAGDASHMLLHAKLYEMGDKYDVTGLKKLACEKFLRACAIYWNDDHFATAAHYAFITTPEHDQGLRDIVSETISQYMELLNKPAVEALLHEFNGLAVGLLKMRATELGWIKPS